MVLPVQREGTLNILLEKRGESARLEERQDKDLTNAARPMAMHGYAQVGSCGR